MDDDGPIQLQSLHHGAFLFAGRELTDGLAVVGGHSLEIRFVFGGFSFWKARHDGDDFGCSVCFRELT
jgi:hypothetical protein